jgi:calcineurin-like phosphoesterase
VIGMAKEEPLQRFLRKLPVERMRPAEGEATISGIAIETDDQTGLAVKVAPLRIGGRLSEARIDFW